MSFEDEPLYMISVVAKMVGVGCPTLRYYERVGIVKPSRTRGGLRLYSPKDVYRLRLVKELTEKLGVNLAGAGLLLRLVEYLYELERKLAVKDGEISRLFRELSVEGFVIKEEE